MSARSATNGSASGTLEVQIESAIRKFEEMTDSVKEVLRTLPLPEQAQQVTDSMFAMMNKTMVTSLEMAENILKATQDAASKNPISPFVAAGMDQLKVAMEELQNSISKVSEMVMNLRSTMAGAGASTEPPKAAASSFFSREERSNGTRTGAKGSTGERSSISSRFSFKNKQK